MLENKKNNKFVYNGKLNYLVSDSNSYSTKWFPEKFLAVEKRKTKVKMNKPIYLGFWILSLSKIQIYKFWYDYIKEKYGKKQN